jgi:GalNAc-alpha-(1->4)-GalNAc-alpha-(1->3)-diNAcBac-PP-undecaprenol alpha-1,4-N-acetyl-D-galactosaminyltransferase
MTSLNHEEKKRNICIVGPALTMGGMERASVNLANTLHALGHQVVFLAVLKQKHFFSLHKDIRFHEPSQFNIQRLSLFKTLFWLRKTIIKEDPEAIIVYNKFYAALTVIALAFTRFRIFISERSSPLYPWPLKLKIINRIAFWLFPPVGIIAQTSIAAAHQRKYYGKRANIAVIPNALRAVTIYTDVLREKVILAVGRLNEFNKGFDQLLDAFAKVKTNDWKLFFAGNDEHGEDLKKQTELLGLSEKVTFLGSIKDMDSVFARASVFVIPSRSEGFPNALCEAMAAGLACVSLDFMAGPRDIINNGIDGMIIKNNSIPALTEAIQYLIDNETERVRLGQNALAIRERYEARKIAQQFIEFIFA